MKSIPKLIIFLLFVFLSPEIFPQVTFKIISMPDSTPQNATIYIAGSFNGWNPGEQGFSLTLNTNNQPEITLPSGSGTIEFKFTRGSWETVEGTENGTFVPNRTFTFGNGQTVEIIIAGWEDTDGSGGGGTTAAPNVHIMSTDFGMPQLNRTRRIWVYLPPDYDTTTHSYPVLYMQDGQNLFDAKTSFSGEWEVDESLNQLFSQGYEVPIVVGIDNGGSYRIGEYTPWKNNQYGGGDGEKYVDFIVETLKPYIDAHYRTNVTTESTGIMGSSLGGLISHYAMVTYPEVFSKIGIFSPSYWFSDSVYTYTADNFDAMSIRAYLMAGDNESDETVPDLQEMATLLQNSGLSGSNLQVEIVPGGQHNEALWRQQFVTAVKWLFQLSPGVGETKTNEKTGYFYPNPSSDQLYFKAGTSNQFPDEIQLIAESGANILTSTSEIKYPICINGLCQGSYIIRFIVNDQIVNQRFIKN
ncbi:MAG: T9SS type A sorting domain-containing protein [Bacteroidales bacterium]|nr:T9SS type A sorting domain-containing protein [Bacteroidales bacterium]